MEGSEHGTKDKELDNHKKMNVAFWRHTREQHNKNMPKNNNDWLHAFLRGFVTLERRF